jgi:ribosomal protein S25
MQGVVKKMVTELDLMTPQEIAEALKVSPGMARKIFQDQPGVLKLAQKKKGTRSYVTIRVPRSIFERYYAERTR